MPAQIEHAIYCPACGSDNKWGCGCSTGPLVRRSELGEQALLNVERREKAYRWKVIGDAHEKHEKRERVLNAAIVWFYDRSCAKAQMELEDAVTDLVGIPINEGACA